MNKAVSCEKAPKAIGPYSQAVEANGTIYVSGQLPIDATTGNFVEGGIKEQCRQSLTNIGYILKQAGYTYKDVVKCTVYLANIADFAAANEVYEHSSPSHIQQEWHSRLQLCLKTLL